MLFAVVQSLDKLFGFACRVLDGFEAMFDAFEWMLSRFMTGEPKAFARPVHFL